MIGTPPVSLGVIALLDHLPVPALEVYVEGVERAGYMSFWIPEIRGREPVATAAHLLARTRAITIATGIANVYARDALAMAQARQTLAEFSGGRFLLGLGVSNVGLNAARGHAWLPPLAKMTAYLDAIDSVALDSVAPATPAPIVLAAHGPRLQGLARARGAGVLTYLMPPAHTRVSRARLGTDGTLAVVCPVLLEPEVGRARRAARATLAYYLGLDYYHREWRKLGFGDADFADGGSDRLIDTIVAWGDRDALAARIAEFVAAGADTVVLMPLDLPSDNVLPASLLALAPGPGA